MICTENLWSLENDILMGYVMLSGSQTKKISIVWIETLSTFESLASPVYRYVSASRWRMEALLYLLLS